MINNNNPEPSKPTILQITWSMIAAFCGVQSNQAHERDFDYIDQAGFKPYIIIGIVLTFVILITLYAIMQIILRTAAS
jgi:hypothetical protein